MERINSTNVAENLHGVGKHGFHGGNPQTGEKSTYFTPEWCNGLQEEVVRVIEAAGITPSGENFEQLLAAIKYFAWGENQTGAPWSRQSSFLSSKVANGWQKLEGGLIIQWGTVGFAASNTSLVQTTVAFPIAFPSACVHISGVQTSRSSNDGGGSWAMCPTNKTKTNFSASLDNNRCNSTYNFTIPQTAEWIAIGY